MPETFVYPFIKLNSGVLRPMVPVLIENPFTKQSTTVMALLDTGADTNCFPAYIPLSTGHDLKNPDAETSINSKIEGTTTQIWRHTFRIHLLDTVTKKTVWKTQHVLVDCVDHDNMPPLLGCIGFLSELKITFNYKTGKIIIELP